jgi:hypothetical protein
MAHPPDPSVLLSNRRATANHPTPLAEAAAK